MMTDCLIVRALRHSILLCFFLAITSVFVDADESFYVFAPDKKNQQILVVSVNAVGDTVSVEKCESLPLPFGPSSIALTPAGKHLIVSSVTKGETPVATVESLGRGKLKLVNVSSLSYPTGYTSVDRSGRFFLTVNYRSGAVAVYGLDEKGVVGEEVCSLITPNREAHCILTTPNNRFAYVPCVKNNNALYQFAFDELTGKLSPLEPFDASPPAMFGPRHIAYHPTLPIAYFSNEQQLGVSVYEIGSDGQLTDKQHAVTMPRRSAFEQGERGMTASDLVLSPDGQRLFVAVRDSPGAEDSVFTFRVEADGRLSQTHRAKVGDIPWKLDLSPAGNFLLVSEITAGQLAILKVNSDGSILPAAQLDWDAQVRDMVILPSM